MIVENISDKSYREDPHLVSVLSTTLNEDEFDFGDEDGNGDDTNIDDGNRKSRRDTFLEAVEAEVDKTNPVQIERLQQVRLKVLDHLKETKIRKNRSRTSSKRKGSHEDSEDTSSSRPRTTSPSQ